MVAQSSFLPINSDEDNGDRLALSGENRAYDTSNSELRSLVAQGAGLGSESDIVQTDAADIVDGLLERVDNLDELFADNTRKELIAFISCLQEPPVAS